MLQELQVTPWSRNKNPKHLKITSPITAFCMIRNVNTRDSLKASDLMLRDGYLLCPDCKKKIMLVRTSDTINGTAYCHNHLCKSLWHIIIADNTLFRMEKIK